MIWRSAVFLTTVLSAPAGDTLSWRQLPPLSDKAGVAAPFAGTSNGALIVAGGANFPDKMPWEGGKKVWHDTVQVLEKPDGSWRDAGRLPRPLAYGVSVSDSRGVVCVGGSDSAGHRTECFRLEWSGEKLVVTPLPALPVPLSGACGALVRGIVRIAGGAEAPGEQQALNRAFELDLANLAAGWREFPPLPGKARILAAAGTQDGAFFVFGGVALEPDANAKIVRKYLSDAWSFSPGAGWRQLAALPRPCAAAPSPAPLMEGKLLLLSGDDGSRFGFSPPEKHPGFPGNVLAFTIAANAWHEASASPAPRVTVPCVAWQGGFVIPSGEVRPGVRSPEVWSVRNQTEAR